ncbi:MAG: HlyD family efflux transporter periplasmic adaptor subunit, partial [Pseudomonadota bacterium]
GTRLTGTVGHAWRGLRPSIGRARRVTRKRIAIATATIALVALMFVPVPMSALAPFEIVARDPIIVTAPLDGVVKSVPVSPNASVDRGDVLVRFEDTELRSRLDVAQRELAVAEARLKRANQVAFQSVDGRRDLAIMRGERDIKAAELAFARELLDRSVIRANERRVAIYGSRKDLVGRPVKTGERLMELADPKHIQVEIFVPVADGGVLTDARQAKLFLDSDPLNPLRADIVRAEYEASTHQADRVSFRVIARLTPAATGDAKTGPETGASVGGAEQSDNALPRLGTRGTAQVYGALVPLGVYLFRRPVTAVRQWVGL